VILLHVSTPSTYQHFHPHHQLHLHLSLTLCYRSSIWCFVKLDLLTVLPAPSSETLKQLTSRQDTWHSARMYHLLLLPSKNFTTLRKSNRICWNAQHCLERHTQKSHLLQVSCVELTTLKTQILPSVFTNDRRNSDRKVAYVECRRLWFYEEKICFIWHRWCDLTRGFDPQLEKLQPQHRCSIEKSAGVAFWPRLTKKIKGSQAIVSSHHLNLKKKSQTWLFPRLHSCILM